jgi:hypothetical protein
MALAARKPFTFFGVPYAPGDTIKEDFTPYQRETLLRTGFAVEVADKPKPKPKAKMVEVVPEPVEA